jgi:hypothetical protein
MSFEKILDPWPYRVVTVIRQWRQMGGAIQDAHGGTVEMFGQPIRLYQEFGMGEILRHEFADYVSIETEGYQKKADGRIPIAPKGNSPLRQ